MSRIETLKGVKIHIYSNDHVPPHIHAIYGEYEILVDIRTVEILKGVLPKNKKKIAISYVRENQDDLLDTFYQLNPDMKQI